MNDYLYKSIFKTIVKAISSYNKKIKLMILSTQKNKLYKKIANEYGIKLLYEVFADRNYTDEGFLVNRTKKNAIVSNKSELIKRVKGIQKENVIISENGKVLKLKAHSICVHGDGKKALTFIKTLNKLLKK